MKRSLRLNYRLLGILFVCLLSASVHAQDDPFVGRFGAEIDGEPHELLIFSDRPGNYDGELRAEGKRLPFVGRRFGDGLVGQIGFADDAIAIRARVLGAVLLLERQSATPWRFYRRTD